MKFEREFLAVFCKGYENFCDCKHCHKRFLDDNKNSTTINFKNGNSIELPKVRKEPIRGVGSGSIIFKEEI